MKKVVFDVGLLPGGGVIFTSPLYQEVTPPSGGEEWPPLHAVRPYVEVSLPEGAEAVYSAAAAARTSAEAAEWALREIQRIVTSQ